MGARISLLPSRVACNPSLCKTFVCEISANACNKRLNGRITVDDEVAVRNTVDDEVAVHDTVNNGCDVHEDSTIQLVGEDLPGANEDLEHNVPEVVAAPELRFENYGTEDEPIVLEFISGRSRIEFEGILESLPIVIE